MEYIAVISLLIFSTITCFYIIKKNKCLVSPYILLTLPNLLIILLCLTLGKLLGYISVSSTLLLYLLFFQFLFFSVEVSVNSLIPSKKQKFYYEFRDFYSPMIEITSKIFILYLLCVLIKAYLTYGITFLLNKKFVSNYSGGISGHALVYLQLISGYYLAKFKNKKNIFIFILIVILNFFTGVFHWVGFAFIGAFIYAILTKKIKLTIKRVLILSSLAILMFVGSYAIIVLANAIKNGNGITESTIEELLYYFRHFLNYLFSGTLCASYRIDNEMFQKNDMLGDLLPLYNMIKILIPNLHIDLYEALIDGHWQGTEMVIISSTGGYSNVPGFLGGLALYGTFISNCLYIILVGIISNILVLLSRRYPYLQFYACYYCIGCFFNWFVNFYNILEFYETIMIWIPLIFIGDKLIKGSLKYGKCNNTCI